MPSWMLWALLAILLVWMLLRFVPAGVDAHRPLPELIALIPLLAVPIAVALAWAVSIDSWPAAACAVLLLALQAPWWAGYVMRLPGPMERWVGVPGTIPGSTTATTVTTARGGRFADELRVMTLNCRFGRADAGQIVHEVSSRHVDVLALQEVSDQLLDRLADAGLHGELPNAVVGPPSAADNGGRNALFTRVRPISSSAESIAIQAAALPAVTVDVCGIPVRAVSAHPKSPGRGGRFWGAGIAGLGRFAGQSDAGHPVMILGDLNASLHHPSLRAVLGMRTGSGTPALSDASYALHRGPHPTFPSSWPGLPALIEIDHVLLSPGLNARAMDTVHIRGSDHRAMCAVVAVDGGTRDRGPSAPRPRGHEAMRVR